MLFWGLNLLIGPNHGPKLAPWCLLEFQLVSQSYRQDRLASAFPAHARRTPSGRPCKYHLLLLGPETPVNKGTPIKQHFHGIVPGFSRTCPGVLPKFPENFVYSFLFSPKVHINKCDPHSFPGQSPEVVHVYWFFRPPILISPLEESSVPEVTIRVGTTLRGASQRVLQRSIGRF